MPLTYDIDASVCNVPGFYTRETDPTQDDDAALNYRVGDQWLNTVTSVVFYCVAVATPPERGAAWRVFYPPPPTPRAAQAAPPKPPIVPFRTV